MADPSLAFSVKVNTDGLVTGLKVSTTSVEQASAVMREALANLGGGAREASDHSEGLISTLRDFKAEATQSGRTANFFAKELSEIIPGADGAASSLRKLITIGLEGFSLGAGIELAVFAIGALNEHAHAAQQAIHDIAAAYSSTSHEIANSLDDVSERIKGPQTATQEAYIGGVKKMREEVRTLNAEASRSATESAGSFLSTLGLMAKAVRDVYAEGLNLKAIGSESPDTSEAAQKARQASAKVQAATDQRPERDRVLEEERRKRAEETGVRIKQIEASTADEVARINTELAAKLLALEHDKRKNEEDGPRLRAAFQADATAKINQIEAAGALSHREAMLALTAEETSEEFKIRETSAIKVARLELDFDKATTAARQTQILDQIQAEQALVERRVEIAAAAHERIRAATITADNKLKAERLQEAVTADQALNALEQQLNDQKFSAQFASAAASIRARQQEETKIVQEGLQKRLISAQQADADMAKINKKASDDRIKALADEQKHFINDFAKPIDSAFATAIKSMVSGTQSFADAMKGLLSSLADAAISGALKALVEKTVAALSTTTAAARLSAVEQVTQESGIAAARAFAAYAGIPFAGPALGAAAAGEAMASTLTWGAPASAAGGFDIPMGINPITQLHQREMVLPEKQADVIRGLAEGGGGGEIHIHVHSVYADANSLRRLPSDPAFRDGMREAQRNGRL